MLLTRSLLAPAVLFTPAAAAAETLTQIVGLFNIFVGLMLVAAFLLLGSGLIMWVIRLGTWPTYRDEAIKQMEWAVAILFVLIVLLVFVRFVQSHTTQALFLLGVAIVGLIAYVGFIVLKEPVEKEEEA